MSVVDDVDTDVDKVCIYLLPVYKGGYEKPDSRTALLSQWDFNPKLRSLTGCRNTPQLTTMFLDNNVIAD